MNQSSALMIGHVDAGDRFTGGDERFTALNARAGGAIGTELAVPQLAILARLARRLEIPVTRPLRIADTETDLLCWVRAKLDSEGVTITLADVRERTRQPARSIGKGTVAPPGADWTWEADAALRLRRIDESGAVRHGIDLGVVLGRPLTHVFTLEADQHGATMLSHASASGRDFDGQRARLPDGAWVRLAGTVLRDAAGGAIGYLGGVYEEHRAAPEPAADPGGFHRQLEQALRTPLARIVAEADAMHAEIDGPLAAHYIDYAADIASAGRHLLALVDDLADLNAIERSDFRVAADEIDLGDLARRAAGLLSVRAADSGVAVVRPEASDEVPATGEFRRVLQILVNLVSNAVRYSVRGEAVIVSVERQGDRALAHVSDRGKGIAAEDQARIFDKFERVDPMEPGGSGLGLYIARRLACAMGGDLTVKSAPGEGACFTLSLPAR